MYIPNTQKETKTSMDLGNYWTDLQIQYYGTTQENTQRGREEWIAWLSDLSTH